MLLVKILKKIVAKKTLILHILYYQKTKIVVYWLMRQMTF